MSIKWLICTVLIVGCCCHDVAAVAAKKRKPYFLLLEAASQRTIPGIPGAAIKTDYFFVIVWQYAKPPGEFYWKGDAWQNCIAARAHKTVEHDDAAIGFSSEQIAAGKIRNGDTLIITTRKGGKMLPPDGIPGAPKNTLWFKSGGSGWLFFTVKNIARKPDIALP